MSDIWYITHHPWVKAPFSHVWQVADTLNNYGAHTPQPLNISIPSLYKSGYHESSSTHFPSIPFPSLPFPIDRHTDRPAGKLMSSSSSSLIFSSFLLLLVSFFNCLLFVVNMQTGFNVGFLIMMRWWRVSEFHATLVKWAVFCRLAFVSLSVRPWTYIWFINQDSFRYSTSVISSGSVFVSVFSISSSFLLLNS